MNRFFHFLPFLAWVHAALASIAAIHNLHKATPLCDPFGGSFKYHEELDFENRKRIITSNSCPNHFNKCQDEECAGEITTLARENELRFEIPLFPVIAELQTDTTCVNGSIAIALNGVSIESMSCKKPQCVSPGYSLESRQSIGDKSCDLNGEGDGTWICGDAVQLDATRIDKCGGHVDDRGLYHYHIPPVCLIQQITELATPRMPLGVSSDENVVDDIVAESNVSHSVQVGWALDGFPIYGPFGPNGIQMQPCSTLKSSDSASFCLDECNGLYGPLEGVDDYLYRYYVTGEMGSGVCSEDVENGGECSRVTDKCCINRVPSPIYQPYTIGCFKGCKLNDPDCFASPTPSTTDIFFPRLSLYPDGVFSHVANNGIDYEMNDTASYTTVENTTNSSTPSSTLEPYLGYGYTAVRLLDRSMGILSKSIASVEADVDIEPLVQSDEDAFITGLTLGPRGSAKSSSLLLFTTQKGLWSIREDGTNLLNFVAGVKTVLIDGFNLANSIDDVLLLTVKDQECSYVEVISSKSIICLMSSMAYNESVEENDVILNTKSGNNIGIHYQPLTVALGASKRAVVSKISVTTSPMTPYSLTYPPNTGDDEFSYWCDLASHRIYRSKVDGKELEIILEEVNLVHSLMVLDTKSIPDMSVSDDAADDHYLFYTDSNRGILGRVVVPSQGRLDNGPYKGGVSCTTSSCNAGDENNTILMIGLTQPRGISAQIDRGYFYFVTYDGEAFEAPLSHFTQPSPSGPPIDFNNPPKWLKLLLRAKTSSRFDGIATLPFSPHLVASDSFKPWNEQYIFIPDTSSHSLAVVNDNSFVLSTLNLNDGFGSKSIVWPRSIASRRLYETEAGENSNHTVVVYLGELLGKIWEVELDFSAAMTGRKVDISSVKTPRLIADFSKNTASIRLRSLINQRASIDNRKYLVFPEVIN